MPAVRLKSTHARALKAVKKENCFTSGSNPRGGILVLLAPSRGGVLLLGETRSAELTLGDPCYGPANAHPPGLGLSSP